MKLSRRTFLMGLSGIGALGAAAGAGFGYMRWGEADWFQSTTTLIRTGRTAEAEPLRILHLSDLHASDVVPLSMISRAVELGLRQHPDLIVITGDFWTDRFNRINDYTAVLKPLSDHAPTFAVAGNHDGGSWAALIRGWSDLDTLQELLTGAGVTFLHNESATLTLDSRRVTLLGVGDWWSGDCRPYRTFATAATREANTLRIVLNHNPDAKTEFADYDWDLMCCGHTHGGQLRMPFTGRTPFAPVSDHDYVAGLNPWRERLIFTTRGVGNLHGLRFNCRPEVSLLLVS